MRWLGLSGPVFGPRSSPSINRDCYSLSGLVLGPANGDVYSENLKYEQLARFTLIGTLIKDYRALTKLSMKVSII
jgi:hypothetical protein